MRTSILLLLLLTACEPVLATVTSLEPQIPDGPPADVDLRVALVIDGEARAYDIDLDGIQGPNLTEFDWDSMTASSDPQ